MRVELAFVARVAIVSGTLASASIAHAQQPTAASTSYPACAKQPSKTEVEAAHGAYLAARSSFDEGDYATAITYFKDAYRRDCTKHELLPIIARAYELSQNRAEAILALDTFLKRVPPNDPQVDAIKKRIQNLRALESKNTAPPPPDANPSSSGSAGAAPPASSSNASSSTTTAPASADGGAERKTNIGPFLVMGAGAVGAIVGGVVLAGGLGKRADAVDRCPTEKDGARVCPAGIASAEVTEQFDAGTSQATVGAVVLGVSSAVLIGGIVWLVVDRTARAPASVARTSPLAIDVSAHAASASYRLAF